MKETERQRRMRKELEALLEDLAAGRQERNPTLAQAVRDVIAAQDS